MSCLVWNARGLGSPRAFHELRQLLSGSSPNIVFLSETHIGRQRCKNWRAILGFEGLFIVDSAGRKGGLIMMWHKDWDVHILSYSQGHIDCMVKHKDTQWRFTGIYGNPEHHQRRFSWDLLKRLANEQKQHDFAWLVGGDFNEILVESEKRGGRPRPIRQMQDFRDTLEECQLYELPNSDTSFTWFNKRACEAAILERLDRFVGNQKWQDKFSDAEVQALDFFGSDHRPLLCRLKTSTKDFKKQGRGRFYWEDKWLLDKNLVPDFLQAWCHQNEKITVPKRLEECKTFLKKWAGSRFDRLGKKIAEMRKRRQVIMGRDKSSISTKELSDLFGKIENAVEQESAHWRQRARMNWLKDGDRNTRTFHTQAAKRGKRNSIAGLFDANGNWHEEETAKAQITMDYFSSLFETSNPTEVEIAQLTRYIKEKITREQADFLSEPFTAAEVKRAIFEIHPTKSPGPDGFTGQFFQKFWPAIGEFMTQEILKILNEGAPVRDWNETVIALIPKKEKPTSMKDFRPISMCNTSYKIISKAIVNRLRTVIPTVIDQEQSGFIPGRLITDNILIGFECVHWLRHQKRSKKGTIALKLDMSKAYDRVEWTYLYAVLERMAFPVTFRNLIMRCVTSVSFSFILNRNIYGTINPSRGLRQGDPLSPFLFVICAQGLSAMLTAFERAKRFRGIPIIPRRPSISHLFFADDSLVFFRATKSDCDAIKICLSTYEKASGQMINFEKSAITCSPSTSPDDANLIRQMMNIPMVQGHAIYLGLPTFSIRQKRIQFGYIRERVQRKLEGFKNQTISAGGKEVLLKSIVQAIPTFTMSCFRLPRSICNDINRMCANFWWGEEGSHRRMHWAQWNTVCQPKERGGLGFRDICSFNKALLAKQVWRILNNPTSLVAQVFKARYFRNCTILEAKVNSSASFVWRSLAWSRTLVHKGLRWQVGNGQSIRAFQEAWIPTISGGVLKRPDVADKQNIRVSDLMNMIGEWDRDKLEMFCWPYEMTAIYGLNNICRNREDKRSWFFEEKGNYSVKSGYLVETGFFEPPPHATAHDKKVWQSMIWSLQIPPKVRIFMWRALKGFIPVETNLLRHHVPTDGICQQCALHKATTEHCLIYCNKIKASWKRSRFWSLLGECKHMGFNKISEQVHHRHSGKDYEIWVIMLWKIWTFICKLKHEKKGEHELISEEQAEALWRLCQEARECKNNNVFLGIQPGEHRWRAPNQGTFRVDVDCMFNKESSRFGIGVIVRDHDSRIVAAMAQPIVNPGSCSRGEVIAILHGIIFCIEQKIYPVTVYSDSIIAVRAMAGLEEDESLVPADLFNVAQTAQNGCILGIFHAYRSATKAAHHVAQFTVQISQPISWRSNFPDWLIHVTSLDYA